MRARGVLARMSALSGSLFSWITLFYLGHQSFRTEPDSTGVFL